MVSIMSKLLKEAIENLEPVLNTELFNIVDQQATPSDEEYSRKIIGQDTESLETFTGWVKNIFRKEVNPDESKNTIQEMERLFKEFENRFTQKGQLKATHGETLYAANWLAYDGNIPYNYKEYMENFKYIEDTIVPIVKEVSRITLNAYKVMMSAINDLTIAIKNKDIKKIEAALDLFLSVYIIVLPNNLKRCFSVKQSSDSFSTPYMLDQYALTCKIINNQYTLNGFTKMPLPRFKGKGSQLMTKDQCLTLVRDTIELAETVDGYFTSVNTVFYSNEANSAFKKLAEAYNKSVDNEDFSQTLNSRIIRILNIFFDCKKYIYGELFAVRMDCFGLVRAAMHIVNASIKKMENI